jgi:hypothetical protein
MKAIYFFAVMPFIIAGCNLLSKSADVRESMPGLYTRQSESEFSKAIDTLTITANDAKAGTYLIIRKTAFNRIVEGKMQPPEYKTEKMLAVYNEKSQQLQDMKTGRLFSFNVEKKELLFGTEAYKKIK